MDSFLKSIFLSRKCKRLNQHNLALLKENKKLRGKIREKEKIIEEYKKVMSELYYEYGLNRTR